MKGLAKGIILALIITLAVPSAVALAEGEGSRPLAGAAEGRPAPLKLSEELRLLLEALRAAETQAFERLRASAPDSLGEAEALAYLGLLDGVESALLKLEAHFQANPGARQPAMTSHQLMARFIARHIKLLVRVYLNLPPAAQARFREAVEARLARSPRHEQLWQLILAALDKAGPGRPDRPGGDRQALERRLEEARARLAKSREHLAAVERRYAELEARLEGITDPTRKAFAERWLAIEGQTLQIARLRMARDESVVILLEDILKTLS